MVSVNYTMNNGETEFSTFSTLAMQLIVKYTKKTGEYNMYDQDNTIGRIIALYIMDKISRYAVVSYLSSHWLWDKTIDSLSLTELLSEADKYKPSYTGNQEPCSTSKI